MKVFVADNKKIEYLSEDDYHWCDDGDILMFGLFQKEDDNSMCGIHSRKFTTNIIVKDLKMPYDFFVELIKESIERSMETKICGSGDFIVNVGFEMEFNLYDIVDELLEKASKFEDNQRVKCFGKNIIKM